MTWAIEVLSPTLTDRLLEIGCGAGALVALLCEKAAHVVAIDRSPAMVKIARERNRAHLRSGKAMISSVALEDAELGVAPYDKIVAINIGLFVDDAARGLAVTRAALAPNGALYLFNQPPIAAKTKLIAEKMKNNLEANGFSIERVLFKDMKPAPAACVIARVG